MQVLVLGANGQLGSDLLRAGQDPGHRWEVTPVFRKDLDVSCADAIPAYLAAARFDALVNCTSYHKTDEVERNATQAVAINAHAVRALAEACKAKGARFVHISTDYVFGGENSRPYVETDCPSPLNVYGASKLLGEQLALRAYRQGTIILRAASLFGVAGASGKGGNFVETMLRIGKEKGQVRVVNDITMSPTGTADLARMIWSLLEREAPASIYHVVNSGQATWFEFAREIIRKAAVAADVLPLTSAEFPTVALRPTYSVLDNRKVAGIVGEVPHWKDALDRYLKAKGHVH